MKGKKGWPGLVRSSTRWGVLGMYWGTKQKAEGWTCHSEGGTDFMKWQGRVNQLREGLFGR